MAYGLPFQASKNRIAKKIVDFLPEGDTFVDLFAGGCAVTHAAYLSGKWQNFIANDIGGWADLFKDVCEGKYKGYNKIPTREGFFAEKWKNLFFRSTIGGNRCIRLFFRGNTGNVRIFKNG